MRKAPLNRAVLIITLVATQLAEPSVGRADALAVPRGRGIAGVAATQATLACGDGVRDAGEGCDDGNVGDGDGCSASCATEQGFFCLGEPSVCETLCGDGLPAGAEGCDDHNGSDGDGCSSSCMVEAGFSCAGAPSLCGPTCGDGLIRGTEACDDGNLDSGDGCAACAIEPGHSCAGEPSTCAAGCGDGVIDGPEECDDGAGDDGDGCSAACAVEAGFTCAGAPSACAPVCGDGLVKGSESCDDGDTAAGDGCSPSCGVETGFSCSGMPSACTPTCSDGLVVATEACDDGNAAGGDGCSAACTLEPGYTCLGSPSACSTICGDGVVAGAEQCDAGDPEGSDCCSSSCQATSCVLPVARDATIRKRARADNEGANTILRVRGVADRAVVAFDLTGLDLDGVASATLVLTIKKNRGKWGPSGQGVGAYALLEDFAEGDGAQLGTDPIDRGTGSGVTWDCAIDADIANVLDDCPVTWSGGVTAPGATDVVIHDRTTSGPVSFDVTPDVRAGTSAWLVRRSKRNDFTGNLRYHSREGALLLGDPALGPQLLLEY